MANPQPPAPPPPPPAPRPPVPPPPPATAVAPAAAAAAVPSFAGSHAGSPAPAAVGSPEALPAVSAEQERKAAAAEARLAQLARLADSISQANAVTGVYGDSGSGKTSYIATAAEYAWEEYHRITRLYAADLGGFGNKVLRLIKVGIMQVWNLRNHHEPFETAELASLGYWPEHILDPFTGYAAANAALIPPQQTRWTIFCPEGHPIRTVHERKFVDSFQAQCPVCRKGVINITNWGRVEEQTVISPGFKHVGLYAYDSGTALEDWIMEDMAGKAARDEMVGQNALKGAPSKIVSGSMVFGSNSMSHYGFSQNRLKSWLGNSRRIPRQVVPPIWTFLELRATDEGNMPIFGPKASGKAITSDIPSLVGNCLHAAKEKDDRDQMVHRLWLTTHSSVNEGNIPHLAKHRGEPGTFEGPYLQDKDGEPAFTTCSLKYFFQRLDTALEVSIESAAAQYPDAPGLDGHGFLDDLVEEVISSSVVSTAAMMGAAARPTGAAPVIAGAAMAGPIPAGLAAGVPPPPTAGVPAAPAGRPPLPRAVAAPAAQPASPAPPAQTTQPSLPLAAPPAAPASVTPAPPAPAAPAAASAPSPVASPAAPAPAPPLTPGSAASVPPAGGAPVRPPATAAVSRPRKADAARPPVPSPPGQPSST